MPDGKTIISTESEGADDSITKNEFRPKLPGFEQSVKGGFNIDAKLNQNEGSQN